MNYKKTKKINNREIKPDTWVDYLFGMSILLGFFLLMYLFRGM